MKILIFFTPWLPSLIEEIIYSLLDSDGAAISNHDQMANFLWTAFKNKLGVSDFQGKNRLGVSDFQGMIFDHSQLLTEENLNSLDDDFSKEEIEEVIKNLPNNHALGPDDFNAVFIKKLLGHHLGRLDQAFQRLLLQQH